MLDILLSVAEKLDVARGTLYKYYDNKNELITDFMLHEMNLYLTIQELMT